MKKKAETFLADDLVDILQDIGKEFGYKVDADIDIDVENTATISYLNENDTLLLSVVVLYGGRIYNKIDIFDKDDKNIYSETIKATNCEMKAYRPIMDKVYIELGKNAKYILNTAEKVYDYGEEHNWEGLEQKHYEILSKDTNLAQMAVADMQDKGIVVPEILKKFRRYSMSFKDFVALKIAKEQKIKQQINRVAKVNKKAMIIDEILERKDGASYNPQDFYDYVTHQLDVLNSRDIASALDSGTEEDVKKALCEYIRLGEYNPAICDYINSVNWLEEEEKEQWFSIKLNQDQAKEFANLLTQNDIENKSKKEGKEIRVSFFLLPSSIGVAQGLLSATLDKFPNKESSTKKITINKKATEDEDLDIKLKVQKNKPAGLDTSSPKALPESIRPMMQDLKDKITTLKETETKLANTKAELDAKYQEAKNESKIVEKQAEIENLTTNIGKLLFAAKNETFQFQDNLVALTHQVKTVPAKATDKWKFEKVFAKLKELMGDNNAQKFLENTLNGLQSQATEKTITELNIFSPTQKQMKTSDTSDTNSFIDALKEIYVNLRNYYLDVKKANNILETELATGTTASKKNNISKKAGESYGWVVNEEDAQDKLDLWIQAVGTEKALDDLRYAMGNFELANNLAYIFRVNDFREGCSDYEEDTEIESSKKIKMVKKAKIGKKAGITVKMELPLANYMEMLKNRAKENGRNLYLADELADYFLNFDTVPEPMFFVDNYLINGEFVEKGEFTPDGEFSELYEKYNGNWETMCENEALFHNDEEACLNLGYSW